MADKLNDLMRTVGKPKQTPPANLSGKSDSTKKPKPKHTWSKNSFGTVGGPVAKKIGRGKH